MKILTPILRFFFVLIGIVLLIALGAILFNYKSDIPLEQLQEKYAFDDSQYLELDGMQVHYRKTGTGHPLVLIHGFGGNLWNWEPWQEILQDSFQVLSLDLPGFGFTGPRPDRDYSTSKYIDFLNRFFQAIEIDSFYLAGNSMGGGIAWQYALAHPEQVQKLVLVNASGYPRKASSGNMNGFKVLGLPVVNQLVTKITPRSILRQTVKDVYGDKSLATEDKVDFYMDMLRRSGNRRALLDKRNAGRGLGPEAIKNVQSPTLILWGDQDLLIPYENAYHFEADITDAKAVVYKGIGHMPMLEIPERSAEEVSTFLRRTKDYVQGK